jgi:magnesium chelatase family protein
MNPCPSGYKMSLNTQCVCTDKEKLRYHKKISGPISDRIDMWIPVYKVEYEKIHNSKGENEKSEEIRQRVVHSIQFQEKLQKKNTIENISPECKTILVKAAKRLNLSNRSYIKTLKMARTIANLAKSIDIKQEHILEALQYRKKD